MQYIKEKRGTEVPQSTTESLRRFHTSCFSKFAPVSTNLN